MMPKIYSPSSIRLIAVFIIFALNGCGGGSVDGQQDSTLARIKYTENIADGTIANYTDANWLFTNYLGDYGIPQEVKPQFMPALKLLANGFDLQAKSGQDVKQNINTVHSMFLQYLASGEATKFFAEMQNNLHTSQTSIPLEATSSNPNFTEPVISEEDQQLIDSAKARDVEERAAIQKIADDYGLPYRIEEIPEQWFIYTPTMKGGGKGGGSRGNGPVTRTHSNVRTWGWRRGDMVWVNGTGSVPGVPGHNAIIWGDGTDVLLADANTDVGVSIARDLQAWFERYTEVRALTPKLKWDEGEYRCYSNYGGAYGCAKDSWQRMNAWWYANNHQGAPYNWNFTNPRDTTKFYCSSLLWNAYNSVGFNVISPWILGSYGLVTPNQIRDSQVVTTFKVSTK